MPPYQRSFFIEETQSRLDLIQSVQIAFLVFQLCFLIGMYFLLFRKIIRNLAAESNRTAQLLAMIPQHIIEAEVSLQSFFLTESDDESNVEKPSASARNNALV